MQFFKVISRKIEKPNSKPLAMVSNPDTLYPPRHLPQPALRKASHSLLSTSPRAPTNQKPLNLSQHSSSLTRRRHGASGFEARLDGGGIDAVRLRHVVVHLEIEVRADGVGVDDERGLGEARRRLRQNGSVCVSRTLSFFISFAKGLLSIVGKRRGGI